MKVKLFVFCMFALLFGTTGRAQEADLSRIPSQTATLVSHIRHKSYEKSVFNFEHGARGDAELVKRLNRYDIRFGGNSENGDDSWLDIVHRRGARSVIRDAGQMSWAEVHHVPVLFASPNPHTGELTHSYAGGRLREISPKEVIVKAAVGHMYVMHVKDGKTDYYVMFRVESIDPKGECTLSWKLVPSPER